ncbi:MAG: translation initiation factor IF-2 [Lachnospiraceae bacterium]|nr:translation initiation factor IF-2 [Lachnospiraceae bacterium]
MAKIRVSTFAKQIDVASKDIVAFLGEKGIEVKAQSNIDESAQDLVMKKFKGEKENSDSKADNPEKPKKKKSSISAVFNAQYSHDRNSKQSNGKKNPKARRENKGGSNFQDPYRPRIKPRGGHGPIREDGTRVGEPTLAEQKAMEKKEAQNQAAKEQAEVKTQKKSNNNEKEMRSSDKNAKNSNKHSDKRSQDRNKDNKNNQERNPKKDKRNKFENNAISNENVPSGKKDSRRQNPHDKKNRKNRNDYRNNENDHYINLEKNGGKKKHKQPEQKPKEEEIKSIKVPDHITVRDLADRMKMQPSQIIKDMFAKAVMLTINTDIPYEKAEEIALEYDILCEHEEKVDVIKEMLKEEEDDEKTLVSRPPVVSVMGHVDHGKTSLLDCIRNTKVTDREAGGITQHIGAYVVNVEGRKITFLDTPGHEAFTAMRMRGASSTDIAILVVAADDGVMPQTVESINHAKAAGVEIIVAVNKIDKPNANIDRVKQELSEYELIPSDWGGSTEFVPVSAKTGEGIDDLLDMILLTADVLELKANPKRNARGLVIESQLDRGKGVVATVLVQKGTLHVGDPISAGSSYGKVRAMTDENGKRVKVAGPSTPVEIQGLNEVPNSGEIFVAQDSEREARSFAQAFVDEQKSKLVEESRSRMSLENLFSQVQSGDVKELDLIVKADVQGSVEAVKQSLEKLSNEEVVVKVIHGGVGSINESDVVLASASNAIIIGFNVRPDAIAKSTAEHEGVDIHLYNVIYNAIEDVERAMKGMLEPIYEEKVIGHGEVRATFKSSKVGVIAGCIVNDGIFQRGCRIRLSREGNVIYDDELSSLKRMKDDVKEVKEGFECGVVLDGFNDIQEADTIETYIMVEVPR